MYSKSDRTLEQVAQRGYSLHPWMSPKLGPDQPAVGGLALNRDVKTRQSPKVPSNLNYFLIL